MSDYIDRHLAHLRAAGRKRETIYDRGRILAQLNAGLPWGLDDASSDEIAGWFAGPHTAHWAPATRNVYWGHAGCYYTWAVTQELLTMNPMLRLIKPPAAKHLPDPVSELELALALARSPDQPWRTAVMLAAYAGLRCCEIVRVRREDVTEAAVLVRRGKGDKPRSVDTAPQLWEYLRDRPPGPLVVGARGRAITAGTLTQEQHRHWTGVGLPAVHMHRFRHWFATELVRAGVDIRTVQELMGHASLSSTQLYVAVVSAQRRAAVRLLPSVGHEPGTSRLVPPVAEAA